MLDLCGARATHQTGWQNLISRRPQRTAAMVNIAAGGVPFNFWRVMESGFLTNIIKTTKKLRSYGFYIYPNCSAHQNWWNWELGQRLPLILAQKKFPWEMWVLRVLLGVCKLFVTVKCFDLYFIMIQCIPYSVLINLHFTLKSFTMC